MSSFLQNYQRQPKLFIDLPSKGNFYDETVIEGGQYMQVPVFGMNAMDEIMFKTPDALFSGEATVQVIKSCIPTILDPWKLVGFDIDYILIAIRIATYGDDMPVTTKCPKCTAENESVLSMTKMLGGYTDYETENSFTIDELTFHLKPLTYKQMSDFAQESYQYERTLYQISQNNDLADELKQQHTKDIYNKTSYLNLRTAITYIKSVTNSTESETDLESITEFVVNNDSKFYNALKEKIFELANQWKVPPVDVQCGGEECNEQYSTTVDLDYASFFGLKFLHSRNLIS